MLEYSVKTKLLRELDNLIPERRESENLKAEFQSLMCDYRKSPILKCLNKEERWFMKNYPELINVGNTRISYYATLRYNGSLYNRTIYDGELDRSLLDGDSYFHCFDFYNYSTVLDLNNLYLNVEGLPKKIQEPANSIIDMIVNVLLVRKRYLEKKTFIKRVLDSRDITVTLLKNNYKDLYNLI